MTALTPLTRAACRVRVRGVVQGVGFRPFVHRLALRHHLDGWVRNACGDVQLALEGASTEIEGFLADLRAEAPPLARIEDVEVETAKAEGLAGFAIEESALVVGAEHCYARGGGVTMAPPKQRGRPSPRTSHSAPPASGSCGIR
jgi:acylphosphatase